MVQDTHHLNITHVERSDKPLVISVRPELDLAQ